MKRPRGFAWRIWALFYNLLEGDHEWAERRIGLIIAAAIALVLLGRGTESISVEESALLLGAGPLLVSVPAPIAAAINFALSLLDPQSLRHALPQLVGFILAV